MKKWDPYKKYGVLSDVEPEDKVDIDQLAFKIGEYGDWGAGFPNIREVEDMIPGWISGYCEENKITLSDEQKEKVRSTLWEELKRMEMDSLD